MGYPYPYFCLCAFFGGAILLRFHTGSSPRALSGILRAFWGGWSSLRMEPWAPTMGL